MTWVLEAIRQSPEILLFLSLAIGFWIGKFQFGRFQLGGVAGSLLSSASTYCRSSWAATSARMR